VFSETLCYTKNAHRSVTIITINSTCAVIRVTLELH